MNTKQKNEMTSMRKKLFAAVAMLLVACIMTVSSTYAWFTLSTAPEVKGITTTVGANGNLEIALGTYDTTYGVLLPSSYAGSSMSTGLAKNEANITWGNLIDLDHETYGLGAIRLYPSRLNVSAGDMVNAFAPLSFPMYGTDGRITSMNANTMLGYYNANGFLAKSIPDTYAGVNAIGSASSVSERQFALNNAISSIVNKRVEAKNLTDTAIRDYSGSLAAIALANYDMNGNGATDNNVISAEDVQVLENLIAALNGSVNAVEDSAENMLFAVLAGQQDMSDDAWEIAVSTIEGKATLTEKVTYMKTLAEIDAATEIPLLEGQDGVIDDVAAMREKLSDATATLTTAKEDSTIVWSEIKDAVNGLLVANNIKICNQTVSDIIDTNGSPDPDSAYQKVMDTVINGDGVSFQFAAGSGIFSDIAEMTGSFTSAIDFGEDGLTFQGITIKKKKPVTVETDYALNANGKLGHMYVLVQALDLQVPDSDTNAVTALTDTFGYTVDLLFRTNAAESYLQLQKEAANRVYADGSDTTAGAGSNMTFAMGALSQTQINNLAEGIRVVFYETPSAATAEKAPSKILGVAVLDTANGVANGGEYKLNLKLVEFSTVGNRLVLGDDLTDDDTTVVDESVSLAPLSANTVKKITALVFLDGDVIDNGDALSNGSLDGKLNLQFSSSASLTPMVNTDLKAGTN